MIAYGSEILRRKSFSRPTLVEVPLSSYNGILFPNNQNWRAEPLHFPISTETLLLKGEWILKSFNTNASLLTADLQLFRDKPPAVEVKTVDAA